MKTRARAAVLGLQLAIAGAACMSVPTVQASPLAAPGDVPARQADGSLVTLRQFGNADGQWFETPDGYSVVRNEAGDWVYVQLMPESARALAGAAVPTTLVVGRDDPSAAGLDKHVLRGVVQDGHTHALSSAERAVGGSNPIGNATGDIPLVVILGYYDDALSAPNCTRCATTDPEVFESVVFGDSGNSVAHYFEDVSRGAVRMLPVSESHGTPNDGVIGWLRLGDATPEGKISNTSSYKSNRVAADAINAAMEYLDFTTYDSNGDGRISSREVSLLIVVGAYEGSYGRDANGVSLSSDSTSPRFWGQSRSFVTSFSGVSVPRQTSNGKTVSIDTRSGGMTYSIIGELHGGHPATMGIMVHELGHSTFALPDLYDIGGESNGVGVWSAMGYGSWGKRPGDDYPGATPALLDAWSRVALGWATPVIPASGDSVTVNVASADQYTVYALPTERENEYFLVENRQSTGYDAGLAYLLYTSDFGGLAVWHIDDNVGTAALNNDNADENHRRVDLVAANGDAALDDASSYGRPSNLFYEGNRTSVSDSSTPSTKLYNGESSGVAISEVSYSAASMTFKALYNTAADGTTLSSTTLGVGGSVAASGGSAGDPGGGGGSMAPMLLIGLILIGLRGGMRRGASFE